MKLLHIGVLIGGIAAGCCANAATITVTGTDTTKGQNIWIKVDGAVVSDYAGAISIAINGAAPSPTLCADMFTNIAVNDTFAVNYYNAMYAFQDQTRGARVAYLFASQWSTVTNATQGAAMQLAIWDIIHDGGDGFSAGRLQSSTTRNKTTSSAVLLAAQNYVTVSLNWASGNHNATIYRHIDGATVKQQLLGTYQPGSQVPEPSTYILFGSGALLLLWRKRPISTTSKQG